MESCRELHSRLTLIKRMLFQTPAGRNLSCLIHKFNVKYSTRYYNRPYKLICLIPFHIQVLIQNYTCMKYLQSTHNLLNQPISKLVIIFGAANTLALRSKSSDWTLTPPELRILQNVPVKQSYRQCVPRSPFYDCPASHTKYEAFCVIFIQE